MIIFRVLAASICILLQFACEEDNDTYLITATSSQEAVDAGMEILKNGGSAMDAALSVALSEIAVTGGKYVSYAGSLNLVYYEAETGNIHGMNAFYNTVKNETDPTTIPKVDRGAPTDRIVNGRTILVPGFMKGVEEAHNRFGKISFENIFDHAISVAEEGIVCSNQDQNAFNSYKWIVTKYPEGKSIFTKQNGTFYQAGDLFKQPALVNTLKRIRSEGSDYMYKGAWAKKFVASARKIGSKITLEDLSNYEVIWSQPVQGTYNGYDIFVHGEPAFGGIMLVESLNLTEISNISKFGHYTTSPQAMATLSQVTKASIFTSYMPDFFNSTVDLSNESRLKKATSKTIWEYMLKSDSSEVAFLKNITSDHSAAIVAVDKWGNMVALIHSINTLVWGANGLFVDGISIPDAASYQQDRIQKTGPGKRLPDGTSPGIVVKEGRPILGFSCIGYGINNQTLTSLINVLDFNMKPDESVNTPTIGTNGYIDGHISLQIEPEKYSDVLLSETKELGGNVAANPTVVGGHWTGIYCDQNTGKLYGTEVWQK